MKIATLRRRGYTLLNTRPYKTQTMTAGAFMIVLNSASDPEGKRYYETIDKDGNIFLVLEKNLDLL